MKQPFSQVIAFFILLAAAAFSWTVANVGVDLKQDEHGASMNDIYPVIIGGFSILAFFAVDSFLPRIRLWTVVILLIVNIYLGIALRLEA